MADFSTAATKEQNVNFATVLKKLLMYKCI